MESLPFTQRDYSAVLRRQHEEGFSKAFHVVTQTVQQSKRLRAVGIEPWIESPTGTFPWARLPDGVDAFALTRRAIGDIC